jgi:hypothetical protein
MYRKFEHKAGYQSQDNKNGTDRPLNGKIDLAASREPQLKEAVSQGFDGSIE